MKRFKHFLWLSLVLLCLSCKRTQDKKPQVIRLGISRQPSSALIYVALANGYFGEEGLIVEQKSYPSGKRALVEGLLTGDVDYVTASKVPFVWKSFSHSELKALASIYYAGNLNRIVARRDRGVSSIKDLKGRKVGTQRASAVHYFLYAALQDNNLQQDSVQLSFHKSEELVDKLVQGEIDAFSMREPYVSQAIKKLGGNALVLSAPDLFIQDELLITRSRNKPEISERLLRALTKAELFAKQHKEKTIAIVAAALGTETEPLEKSWTNFHLEVSLDQGLLPLMENQARWLMSSILKEQKELPALLDFVDSRALTAVKPEAVTLVQ